MSHFHVQHWSLDWTNLVALDFMTAINIDFRLQCGISGFYHQCSPERKLMVRYALDSVRERAAIH